MPACLPNQFPSNVETRVPTATNSRSTPNNSVKVLSLTRREAGAPISPPHIEASAKTTTTIQSTLMLVPMRETSPTTEAMINTNSDAEDASRIVNPSASTSIGTTAKPPPTPKKPVRKPVAVAQAISRGRPRPPRRPEDAPSAPAAPLPSARRARNA